MRCLLLNQYYPPDTPPTGLLFADLAAALAAAGHEVHVLAARPLPVAGNAAFEACPGVVVHRLSVPGSWRGPGWRKPAGWLWFHLLAGLACRRLGGFDAVVAMTTPPFISRLGAALRRQGLAGRLVLWQMDLWPDAAVAAGRLRDGGAVARALRRLEVQARAAADAIVAVGPCMAARLAAQGVPETKLQTISNWVPGELVSPLPNGAASIPGLPPDAWTLLYAGNIGELHEFDTLLAAAALLQDEPRLHFVIAGAGTRLVALERAAAARGLRNFHFPGAVPPAALSRLLAAGNAHLACMSAAAAGIIVPSKACSAMAAARPLLFVGPAAAAPATMLREADCGFHLDSADAAGLAAAIRRLADEPELAARLGDNGREYYRKHLCRGVGLAKLLPVIAPAAATRRQER